MTSTIDKLHTGRRDEFHTQDEVLRGIDFRGPIIKLGAKAVEKTSPVPLEVSHEEANTPHEYNGFGD